MGWVVVWLAGWYLGMTEQQEVEGIAEGNLAGCDTLGYIPEAQGGITVRY